MHLFWAGNICDPITFGGNPRIVGPIPFVDNGVTVFTPSPILRHFCYQFRMKNLLTEICLTFAVLLASTGVSWSGDYLTGLTAYRSGDYVTALRDWTRLAEQGDALAQSSLGFMYEKGRGVPKDDKEAVKWYNFAAEQGDASAQYNLGLMYKRGQGVLQDNVYAHMWWHIAASSGDKIASRSRDIITKRMTPADISTAQDLFRECVRKKYKGC